VGELLLRREREETAAISHLAQELLDKEYRTPTRELRCSAERAACLQCYTDSAAGPLACTAQVEAFAKCADAALRVRALETRPSCPFLSFVAPLASQEAQTQT
jgi:hypothetical protein